MNDGSSLVASGSVIAGAFMALVIVVASYFVAGLLFFSTFSSDGGSGDGLFVLLVARLPGLMLAAGMLHRRCQSRTLLGLVIGVLVTLGLLAVLVARFVSGFHLGF